MMKARSTWGRNFITVCKCAGWGDVGYVNRWTMEIANSSRNKHIPLVVGRRIAQIVFFEVEPILDQSLGAFSCQTPAPGVLGQAVADFHVIGHSAVGSVVKPADKVQVRLLQRNEESYFGIVRIAADDEFHEVLSLVSLGRFSSINVARDFRITVKFHQEVDIFDGELTENQSLSF
jgi:hypothetical protein